MKVNVTRLKLRKTKGNYKPEAVIKTTNKMRVKMDAHTLRVASFFIGETNRDERT
jgi:hypothetical protein